MVIRRKSSVYKKYCESIGQETFFGYDNLNFKTVNLSKKQHFKNLCAKFNLKLLIKRKKILIDFITLL